MSKPLIVAPSILSADFAHMGREVSEMEDAGANWVHVDVMDGSFVPPITFGEHMVRALRPYTKLPMDVHLMVEHPETQVASFAEAGADMLTFHLEAASHTHRLLRQIKELGKKAGIAIVPSTPASALSELFCELDLILVMSVNPGYGGQGMILQTLQKIAQLAEIRREQGFAYQISIDGGVNAATIQQVTASGVDAVVVGSAFFSQVGVKQRQSFVQKLRST